VLPGIRSGLTLDALTATFNLQTACMWQTSVDGTGVMGEGRWRGTGRACRSSLLGRGGPDRLPPRRAPHPPSSQTTPKSGLNGNMSNSRPWHEVMLRQKYNDPRKLKQVLDKVYGSGNYLVKVIIPFSRDARRN
jgi:hypothetical protein